jgi:acetyl esterase/lipase
MSTIRSTATEVDQQDIDEARAFNAKLDAILASMPPLDTVAPELTRQQRRAGTPIAPAPVFLRGALDIEVPGPVSPIKVRIIHPDQKPTGIYLHLHGGGWTLGAHDMQDEALKLLANETGLVAASIGYGLAPERPYPDGPDDCEAAVLHLLEHGPRLLDAPSWFAIGGESAGAHLSVVTLLRLRDRHGIKNRIGAANLVFGVYDLNGTPSQILMEDRQVLSRPILRWFGDTFLPSRSFEERRDPDISPLYANLTDMPRALFTVGTMDRLIDDSLFMAERWRIAGNVADLAIYPEGLHGFSGYPISLARKANARQFEFLRGALS